MSSLRPRIPASNNPTGWVKSGNLGNRHSGVQLHHRSPVILLAATTWESGLARRGLHRSLVELDQAVLPFCWHNAGAMPARCFGIVLRQFSARADGVGTLQPPSEVGSSTFPLLSERPDLVEPRCEHGGMLGGALLINKFLCVVRLALTRLRFSIVKTYSSTSYPPSLVDLLRD